MPEGSKPFFHILPWVIFILSILMLVFFIFTAYYSYQTGKLAGVSGFESTTILIFSIIFSLLMIFLFIWSIVHLFKLYSGKSEKKVKMGENVDSTDQVTRRPSSSGRIREVQSNREVEEFGAPKNPDGSKLSKRDYDSIDNFLTS